MARIAGQANQPKTYTAAKNKSGTVIQHRMKSR